ncbi:DgyrCDS8586 [Dimorphilus gyrociliatus]|uniref:DgyrCDS8586 n=1 Tax=Dimorphilus gyrociliatus TaxID=2664684 RepID=A0A7I8VZR1_9ANNE|nr:DgyrCDS8586 [Dimorphilus gyrociliatus]
MTWLGAFFGFLLFYSDLVLCEDFSGAAIDIYDSKRDMTQSTSQPIIQLNNVTVSLTNTNESDTTANLYETQTAHKQPSVWQTTDSGQRKQTSLNTQTTPEKSTITTLQSRLTSKRVSQTIFYRLFEALTTERQRTMLKSTQRTTQVEISSEATTIGFKSSIQKKTSITSLGTEFPLESSTKEREKASSRQTNRITTATQSTIKEVRTTVPAVNPDHSRTTSESELLSNGALIAIVAGSIIIFVLLMTVCILLCKCRSRNKKMHCEREERKMFITPTDLGEHSLFMETARASVIKTDFEKITSDYELPNEEIDEKTPINQNEDDQEIDLRESSKFVLEVFHDLNLDNDIPQFNYECNTFTRRKPEEIQQPKIRKTTENFITTHL